MRELRFRGWNKSAKFMYEQGDKSLGTFFDHGVEPAEAWVVMQYTGLNDKNGKEIYEGDILKVVADYEEVGFMAGEIREVYFYLGGFRLRPKMLQLGIGHWLEDGGDLEIIGNIHQNPELIT